MTEWHPSMRVTERGPAIEGLRHKGREVPAWIANALGQRAVFDRVAQDDPDGGTPLSQMNEGESLMAPGLIYRAEQSY